MLIDLRAGVRLGVREDRAMVAVPRPKPARGTAFPDRRLRLRDTEVFELGLWCGTCPTLFTKLSQPAQADLGALHSADDRLAAGLDHIDDDVLRVYGSLLPESTYTVLLIELTPRLVLPGGPGDYFTAEQVTTWGVDPVTGVPENPGTPYYRSFEGRVADDAQLYEFVVPMVPPSWNEPATVADYAARTGPTPPTAVAYSLLDVIGPAVKLTDTDWYWHWNLQHFLLDGHHKLAAAAHRQQPVRLLSLLDERSSIADEQELRRLLEVRAQPAGRRGTS